MNTTIKVVGIVDEPYVMSCFLNFPNHCSDPGIDIMLLYYQLIAFGFRVSFLKADNMSEGYRMIAENVADISGFSDTRKSPRLNGYRNDFHMTMPLFEEKTVIFHRQNKPGSSPPNLLLYHCPYTVWLFVFVTLLGGFACKMLHRNLKNFLLPAERHIRRKNVVDNFSSEFPLTAWSLCFGVFLSIYSQYLGITLTDQLQTDSVPFSNIDSLMTQLTKGACKLVLKKTDLNDVYDYYFTQSERVKQTLRKIPFVAVDNDDELIRTINRYECYLGICLETAFYHLNAKYDGLKPVRLDDAPLLQYVYYYRKNHPMKNRLSTINSGSAHSKYYQYLQLALNKIYFAWKIKKRNNARSDDGGDKPLTLNQLKSSFWLLIAGLSLSCFSYGLIVVYDKFRYVAFSPFRRLFNITPRFTSIRK